jgi:hypothetical protein
MAVRTSEARMALWKVKFAGDVISPKMEQHKPTIENYLTEIFSQQETLENSVKILLSDNGIKTLENPWYLDYAREVYRLVRTFSGDALKGKLAAHRAKWITQGLNGEILIKIERLVSSLDI